MYQLYLTIAEIDLSDAVDRGITVTEIAAMDEPIDVSPETTAAFIGRALRGPLNIPVFLQNFGEFRRRFGDVWSRSSLGPSVQQFFQHGGKNLYVVRVANSARGAMICIPASGSALVLRALEPGSTECIRAAVDYDGIDDDNDEHFNLTLQRIDAGTGLILDQEIFRQVSHLDNVNDSGDFVGDELLKSSLVRIEHPHPSHRPEATVGVDGQLWPTYIDHVQEGSDGNELSDYDLIGSRRECTGLFSLQQVEHFDLLYLPPPGKGTDTGPAAVLAAELYCRERGAMLIVDPGSDWCSPDDAVHGVRQCGYASPNMLGYFPRLIRRTVADDTPRAMGGAVAGLLCKLDRMHGPWQPMDIQGLGFDRTLMPAIDVDEENARMLVREGLNVIAKGAAGRARLTGSRTMGRGSESHRMFNSLPVRRLCLGIANAIDRATRWAVFEQPDARLAEHVRGQVYAYLYGLANLGAIEDIGIAVHCDAGMSKRANDDRPGVTILITIQPRGCDMPISLTLQQTVAGYRVANTAFAPIMDDCA